MDHVKSNTQKRGATRKQLTANRKNAKKSTGPKTPQGKAKSSANALKHGLCALSPENVVIPGEDPAEFEAFQREILNDLRPGEAAERLLAERIALAQWRLRRAAKYEGQLVEASLATVRRQQASKDKWRKTREEPADPHEQAALEIPRAVDLCLAGKAHWNMVRYEGHIERGMFRAIKQLLELKQSGVPISALTPLPRVFDPVTGQQYPGAQYHLPPGMSEDQWPAEVNRRTEPSRGPVLSERREACRELGERSKDETNPFSENASQIIDGPGVTEPAGDFDEPVCPPPTSQPHPTATPAPRQIADRPPQKRS